MTFKVRIVFFLGLILISFSFAKSDIRKLNFSSEEDLTKSVLYFSDSIQLFQEYGREYDYYLSSNCMRTVSGSSSSRTITYKYLDLGVDFIYGQSANVTPNDDFNDVEISNEKEWFRIKIKSNSKIPVFGLLSNQSEFRDLNKLDLNGKWVQFVEREDDQYFFSFVSKFVNFNSQGISKSIIDSLSLDCDDTRRMNNFFDKKKIKDFTIRDSDSFYLRVID